jgi:hypothetical protein
MRPPTEPYRDHAFEPDAPYVVGGGGQDRVDADEGRVSRGFRLASEAWDVFVRDPKLALLPLAASLASLAVAGAFLGPALAIAAHGHRALVLLVALAIASYPLAFVTMFFEVVLDGRGPRTTLKRSAAAVRRR